MIRNIGIIAVFWLYGVLAGEIESQRFFQTLSSLFVDKALYFYGFGLLSGVGLICLANLCSFLGWYTFMYVVCRLALAASQLFIAFICFATLFFVLTIRMNLWIPCGVVFVYLATVWLSASCLSLRIFDFNYPVRQQFYDAAAVLTLSFLITSVIAVL